MRKVKWVILFLIGHLSCLVAQSPEESFEQANAAYNGGNYALAIEKYSSILSEGVHSAEVYFNLGNAHYRLGDVAESVFYFEQALRLDPNDEAIQNNIAFARNMSLDAIEPLPQTQLKKIYQFLLSKFTLDQWAYLTVLLVWISAGLLGCYRWSKRMNTKRIFFVLGIVIILFSLFSLSITQSKLQQFKEQRAIVFAQEIEVWGEPNKRSDVLFLLHEGAVVEVEDILTGWSKIKLANGSIGWVENDVIKTLN